MTRTSRSRLTIRFQIDCLRINYFLIRGRGDYYPDFKNALLNFIYFRLIFEPAHFIMERKMMLGVKERAEATTNGNE